MVDVETRTRLIVLWRKMAALRASASLGTLEATVQILSAIASAFTVASVPNLLAHASAPVAFPVNNARRVTG